MGNKTCLVIYLAEYKSLSSSCKRTLGMLKGVVEKGYDVDFLTVETEGVDVNITTLPFLKGVSILPLWKVSGAAVSIAQRKGFKGVVLRKIADLYHLIFIFGHTRSFAQNVKIDILPRKKYDVIISVSDPKTSHIALKSLLKQGLKAHNVVEYWGDPLFGDVSLKTLYPSIIIKRIEKNLLTIANRIVYTSPFTLEKEKGFFPSLAERMIFVPTANLEEHYYTPLVGPKYNVGYYGDYYSLYRNIKPLYDAFSDDSIKERSICLTIVGDSDVHLESTSNVLIKPRQNISELEAKTDILICLLNSKGTQIPGKLYYNAGTNLPIIVILDGEYKEDIKIYLNGFKRFVCCENKKDSIIEAIKYIVINKPVFEPSPSLTPQLVASAIVE